MEINKIRTPNKVRIIVLDNILAVLNLLKLKR